MWISWRAKGQCIEHGTHGGKPARLCKLLRAGDSPSRWHRSSSLILPCGTDKLSLVALQRRYGNTNSDQLWLNRDHQHQHPWSLRLDLWNRWSDSSTSRIRWECRWCRGRREGEAARAMQRPLFVDVHQMLVVCVGEKWIFIEWMRWGMYELEAIFVGALALPSCKAIIDSVFDCFWFLIVLADSASKAVSSASNSSDVFGFGDHCDIEFEYFLKIYRLIYFVGQNYRGNRV